MLASKDINFMYRFCIGFIYKSSLLVFCKLLILKEL